MGNSGEVFKAFDIKDGYGVHEILPVYGIDAVIMTGRYSQIVQNRAKELEIKYVLQNVKNKGEELLKLARETNCDVEEIAYIGDDIIDVEPMKMCGLKGCPADAVTEVKEICDYVSVKKGGEGAVRDFIEWIVRKENV